MPWFSSLAIVSAYAGVFLCLRVMGVPRQRLQVLAASPFIGAFIGFLSFWFAARSGTVDQGLNSREALWFVVGFAMTWYLLFASWIGVGQSVLYWKQAAKLREWTTPPYEPSAAPDLIRETEHITQYLDELTAVVAVKFVPCEAAPADRAIPFEDWTELPEAEPRTRARSPSPHLIVPMWARLRIRRLPGTDLLQLLPRNPFRVVMMTFDATGSEVRFSAAADTPFCEAVMRSLLGWRVDEDGDEDEDENEAQDEDETG